MYRSRLFLAHDISFFRSFIRFGASANRTYKIGFLYSSPISNKKNVQWLGLAVFLNWLGLRKLCAFIYLFFDDTKSQDHSLFYTFCCFIHSISYHTVAFFKKISALLYSRFSSHKHPVILYDLKAKPGSLFFMQACIVVYNFKQMKWKQ